MLKIKSAVDKSWCQLTKIVRKNIILDQKNYKKEKEEAEMIISAFSGYWEQKQLDFDKLNG